ncbi:hypothetical protein CTAYLR_008989 [Chrysophaeum taylorii]|uniref:Rho-GAP domain-containing protein n=1 Tax=Chrysophaeum taylorii TaxID=2483200 RepID=A0AAD7UR63_9STRA|nr:hypothetical protein CTAYLR_008989 [Chrysophaeum taylorii]
MPFLCCRRPREQETLPQERLSRQDPDVELDHEAIVDAITDRLRKTGLESEGIFRVPGDHSVVMLAVEQLEKGLEPRDVVAGLDPEVLATLLKRWLRDRCETVLSNDSSRVSEAIAFDPITDAVLDLLADVDQRASLNLMPAKNLATVFAPIFVKEPNGDALDYVIQELNPFIARFTAWIIARERPDNLPLPPDDCLDAENSSLSPKPDDVLESDDSLLEPLDYSIAAANESFDHPAPDADAPLVSYECDSASSYVMWCGCASI